MKKKIISILLVLTMVLSLMPAITVFASADGETPAWADGGGKGTEEEPYLIKSYANLKAFTTAVNGGTFRTTGQYIKLDDSFPTETDEADKKFDTPIGSSAKMFNGTFDGNGKNIVLAVEGTGNNPGLFDYIDTDGIVKNVSVSGTVSGAQSAGGIARENHGIVVNCNSTCTVTGVGIAAQNVGGIVGENFGGKVINCYAVGGVSGYYTVGGVVGSSNNGTITNCYATGTVSGTGFVGGVVGNNNGTVTNCYATGTVSGTGFVGGVVGDNNATVTKCYYKAPETPADYKGIGGADNDESGKTTALSNEQMTGNQGDCSISWASIVDNADGIDKQASLMTALNEYAKSDAGVAAGCRRWVYKVGQYPTLERWVDYDISWYVNHEDDTTYTLKNTAQLEGLARLVNDGTTFQGKTVKLADDYNNKVALTTSIGVSNAKGFGGTFDGNGKEIKLSIDLGEDLAGLFGFAAQGTIKNVKTSGTVKGNETAGGIAGAGGMLKIDNCSSSATVVSKGHAGGIIGSLEMSGSIYNCYSTGDVTGCFEVGGIAGGFICQKGYSQSRITVYNCFSRGNVTKTKADASLDGDGAGGIVGAAITASEGSAEPEPTGSGSLEQIVIYNCYYATGTVKTDLENKGAIVGYQDGVTIMGCFSTTDLVTAEGKGDNGLALPEPQMKAAMTDKAEDNWVMYKYIYPDGSESESAAKMALILSLLQTSALVAEISDMDSSSVVMWNIHPGINDGYPFLVTVNMKMGYGNDSYILSDTAGLEYLALIVNNGMGFIFEGYTVRLAEDFDNSVPLTTPIGTIDYPFEGTFDGNGQEVKLAIDVNSNNAGMFGCVKGGTIVNTVTSGTVKGIKHVGGIVGYNNGNVVNSISSCSVSGKIVGGIVGYNDKATVTNCYATGKVSGSTCGGVVGCDDNGTIKNCFCLDNYESTVDVKVPESQLKGAAGTKNGEGWAELPTYGKAAIVDALNDYAVTDEGVRYGCFKWKIAGGYPVYKEIAEISGTTTEQFYSVQYAIDAAKSSKTVTLIDDVRIGKTIILLSGNNVTLDLNSHVLDGSAMLVPTEDRDASVIYNYGTLTITDTAGSPTEHYFADKKCAHNITIGETCLACAGGSNKAIADGTYETMITIAPTVEPDYKTVTGGVITGGKGTIISSIPCGGGIYNGGTLTVKSGNIIGNTAGYGGGVFNAKDKSFTFEGGQISDNTASYNGGGVDNQGTFEMKNGTITRNRAVSTANKGSGGGVSNGKTFTLTTGTISDNKAIFGGGVYNVDGAAEFTMSDGTISGNMALGAGGGVFNYDAPVLASSYPGFGAKVTMTGGTITNNKATIAGGLGSIGKVTLGKKAKITGNTVETGGIGENYCVVDASGLVAGTPYAALADQLKSTTKLLTGEDALVSGAQIDVSFAKLTGADFEKVESYKLATGKIALGTSADAQYFNSDNTAYKVKFNNNDTTDVTTDDYIEIAKYSVKELPAKLKDITVEKTDKNAAISLDIAKAIAKDFKETLAANDTFIYAASTTEGNYKYVQYNGSAWGTEQDKSLTDIAKLTGKIYVIGTVTEKTKEKVTLSASAIADIAEGKSYSGPAVTAKKDDQSVVTLTKACTYTYYAADDTAMATPIQKPTAIGSYKVKVEVSADEEDYYSDSEHPLVLSFNIVEATEDDEEDASGFIAKLIRTIFHFKSAEMFTLGEFFARLVERILDIFR